MAPFSQRLSWTKGGALLALFTLLGLMFAAGGLGTAPAAALGGLVALAVLVFDPTLRRLAPPANLRGAILLLVAALFAWIGLTLAWAPEPRWVSFFQTASGAAGFAAIFLLCQSTDEPARRLARSGIVLGVAAAGAFFAFELLARGPITSAFRTDYLDPGLVWRNLGHGLSAWLLLLPAALVLLPWRDRLGAGLGAALVATAAGCALGFGLTSNFAGLLAGALGGAAAWRWPRGTIAWLGGLTALALLTAPVFGLFGRAAPERLRELLPLSWEHRLEAWAYVAGRIRERPLTGWGFDSSRAMEGLPLHPHNAGLQIWVETGAVGAALAAGLALALSRAVARAPGLARGQAIAAAAVWAGYLAMAQASYGVWQEWWLAAAAWAAAAAALTGPAVEARA